MKKIKQLVYKSKHGDIPILARNYVPDGEVWFFNGESLIDIFDQKIVSLNVKSGLIKKVRFITKLKKWRAGKITNIL